jgi:UDP-3-O-[3-hydroxymyristoyl] N-acetylglucosamine deacetylase
MIPCETGGPGLRNSEAPVRGTLGLRSTSAPATTKGEGNVAIFGYRNQRTIARPVEVQGIGYITGKTVRLRFRPAPAGTGAVFVRNDLGPQACISAHVDNVAGTNRRTTLGDGPLQVGLVEHVLAALGGMRIDNCYLELDAPEPPGLDGSALGFLKALETAGAVIQKERRLICGVDKTVLVRGGDATLALHPLRQLELRASYFLDYGQASPIQPQRFTSAITPEDFASAIAPCRTFLLDEEAKQFKKQGLGARTEYRDLLVFGPRGPIDNRLRFANEPARHKVLDIIGDLFLLGHDLCGHLVACRSGHPLNVELVHALQRQVSEALPRQKRAA